MKSTTRIISLILAVLIVLSTVSWVLTMVISAEATSSSTTNTSGASYVLERVYGTNSTDAAQYNNNSLRYERGNSAKTSFAISERYTADFTITVTDTSVTELPSGAKVAEQRKADADSGSFSKVAGGPSTIDVSEPVAVNGGIRYTVTAKKLVYSGIGKTLGITVTIGDGYTYYVSLDVNQCKETVIKEPSSNSGKDDDEKPKTATPYLIVSNYNYGGDIVAGQNFKLSLTVLNTSENTNIENVIMTLTMPEGLSITSSSNTYFFSEIEMEKTISKTLEIQAKPNAKPESQPIKVDFKYEYVTRNGRESSTTSETIAIPLIQPDRFTADPIEMVPEVMMGEEILLTVNYVNKGRGEIYNLSAAIDGNIQTTNQRQNVGNVEAGKSGSVDFYVTCHEPGQMSGNVTLTYEDVNMVVKTVTVPYSASVINVDDTFNPGMPNPGEEPNPMPEDQNNIGKYIAIGIGGLVAAGIVAVVVVKHRKKKAAQKLAELLEEEDTHED